MQTITKKPPFTPQSLISLPSFRSSLPVMNSGYYYLLSNFSYLSPGFWYTVHQMAVKATTPESITRFHNFIGDIFPSVFDIKVRLFLVSYLNNYPPHTFPTKDGRERNIGYLAWSWSLHRLLGGLDLPGVETLYEFLVNSDVCREC